MNRTVDVKALVSHIVRGDGVDRCRICMGETTQGQVFLEDTVMLDGERPVTLAELLKTLTGIEVESSELLPTGVCGTCATQALAAEKFRDLCKTADHLWALYSNCLDGLGSTEDRAGLYVISNGIANPTLLTDPQVPSKDKEDIIKRIKNLQLYKKTRKKAKINDNPLKNFPCPECNYIFNVRQRLNKHIRFMQKKCCRHCDTIVSFKDLEAHYYAHEVPVFHCMACTEVFDRLEELETHRKSHQANVHICQECNNSFMTAAALQRHIESHSLISCPTCYKLFSTWNCFSKHKRVCFTNTGNEENKCADCETNFNNLEELNRHTLENGYKICCFCRVNVSAEDFEKHVKRHDNDILTCEECLDVFDDEEEFELHNRDHANEAINCKICNIVSTSVLTLLTHMKYSHSMNCQTCHRVFTNRDCFDLHIQICSRTKKQQEYIGGPSCPMCEQIFYSLCKLKTHLMESKLRVCWVCKKIVPILKMKEHISRKHGKTFFSCGHCDDIFATELKLEKHTSLRHKSYPYKCIDCHRTFDSQFGLNMHTQSHKPNVCSCEKRFDTKACFMYHRTRCEKYRNATKQVYICDHCNEKFTKKLYLQTHLALKHMNSRRHQCSTCGKCLNSNKHMIEHEATHKVVRDVYICEVCSLKMTSRRGYEKHMMKHSGCTFQCPYCNRSFTNKGHVTSHITRKHPEYTTIFPCTICKKKYTRNYNLEKHMRERHID